MIRLRESGMDDLNLRGCLKIAYFTQFLCCQKNLILKILDVFLWLNSSSALNLNKLSNFQTASEKMNYRPLNSSDVGIA